MINEHSISIFIPVFNEEEILERNLVRLDRYLESKGISFEILVVSNGSTDKTSIIAKALQDRFSWLRFFELPNKGAGEAFKLGIKEARGEHVITLDMDLSSDLVFIDYAIDLLKYVDMVIGSKTMGKQRRSPVRVLGSQFYLLCTQVLFNLTLSDYSMGCKAFKKSEVLPHLAKLDSWTGYVLDLALLLSKAGKKIVQVGIDCDDQRESRFNLLHEGFYRFWHLYKTYKRIRCSN